jgi:hypothetical protein
MLERNRAMLKAPAKLTLVLSLTASALLGDVIELKTGERLEGTFKQATTAGVVIEVGGQSINMPLEKVRVIYLGSAPPPQTTLQQPNPQTPSAHDALQALKAVQSVTSMGVNYRDYATRVQDAKIKVDQFIESPQAKETPGRDSIRLAMRYYEVATQAWALEISPARANTYQATLSMGHLLNEDKEIGECPGLRGLLATVNKPTSVKSLNQPDFRLFYLAGLVGKQPAVLWSCASDKIAEAERLVDQPRQASFPPTPQTTAAQTSVAPAPIAPRPSWRYDMTVPPAPPIGPRPPDGPSPNPVRAQAPGPSASAPAPRVGSRVPLDKPCAYVPVGGGQYRFDCNAPPDPVKPSQTYLKFSDQPA